GTNLRDDSLGAAPVLPPMYPTSRPAGTLSRPHPAPRPGPTPRLEGARLNHSGIGFAPRKVASPVAIEGNDRHSASRQTCSETSHARNISARGPDPGRRPP